MEGKGINEDLCDDDVNSGDNGGECVLVTSREAEGPTDGLDTSNETEYYRQYDDKLMSQCKWSRYGENL